MIVLPTAHSPGIDPDALAAAGARPRAPLCQRCGREATFDNPVGVTFRKTWTPFDRMAQHRHIDAICAECREQLKR